jgi:hypothetical protein
MYAGVTNTARIHTVGIPVPVGNRTRVTKRATKAPKPLGQFTPRADGGDDDGFDEEVKENGGGGD